MSEKTGGPAFPVAIWHKEQMRYVNDGMTLRDYLAAKAMQSLIMDDDYLSLNDVAHDAYRMADLMIEARDLGEME